MKIDTYILECFISIAETGSFTASADFLNCTQSAISQQIAKLESFLSKKLINRTKPFTLTTDGEVFLTYARRIYSLHCEVIDRFRAPDLEGTVRFGLPEDFASVFLSDVLSDFARLHPRIVLNIECDFTSNLYERFKRRQFDIVLVKMNRPEDFPNSEDVWSEPLEWVGDKTLIETDKPLPLVLSPMPCVYRAQALEALERCACTWHILFSSPSFAGTVAAVKAGMGITVLPRTMIPDDLEVIKSKVLPRLSDVHVSLLKHQQDNMAINSLEGFVLKKLRH